MILTPVPKKKRRAVDIHGIHKKVASGLLGSQKPTKQRTLMPTDIAEELITGEEVAKRLAVPLCTVNYWVFEKKYQSYASVIALSDLGGPI